MLTKYSSSLVAAVALLGGLVIVLAGSWAIVERGVQRVLERQAVVAAERWASKLSADLPEVERLIAGFPAEQEQIRFIRQMSALGDIFRWRLFDETGALTFDTRYFDEIAAGWSLPAEAALDERANRSGASEGWPRGFAVEGDGQETPRHYAVAFDRIVADGAMVGTLEVFIDQTEQHATLLRTLKTSGVYLTLLIVLVFLTPVAGLLWQTRNRAAAESAREHAATHDALTGLLDRHAFGEAVDGMIADEPGRLFHLLYFNIRRFRRVNETFGHHAGDAMLREVARRLERQAGAGSVVSRLGVDEFALVDPSCAGLQEAQSMARQCLREVGQPLRIGEGQFSLVADCGITQHSRHGKNAATLLTRASLAVESAADEEGESKVQLFERAMEQQRSRRLAIERRLRRAVEEQDFHLAFQPIYTSAGALAGCEALLRLDWPDGGTISPSEFIPIAEETLLIVPLGHHVLRRACSVAASWPGDLTVAVNISPIEFHKDGPVDAARRALAASGLPAHRLEIEVTESALIENSDRMALQLDQFKEMGVLLALDDFGTAYSNLGHISKFPFDRLKIDRSFVGKLTEGDPSSERMLRVIATLGELLGLEVTAEGIETPHQASEVQRLGVDFVQGFYYSRPLDAPTFERLIRGPREERPQPAVPAGAAPASEAPGDADA